MDPKFPSLVGHF